MVVHTSGSTEMKILSVHKDFGVLYPLQTLTRDKLCDFKKVPFCIEGNSTFNIKKLKKLVTIIGSKCYQVDSKQRLALHVSAVFASNFTNYLFSIAYDICMKTKYHLKFFFL